MSQSDLPTDLVTLSDLEQAVDRVVLPPLPAEPSLDVQIPGIFELTTGNPVTFDPESVETYVNYRN